MADDKTNKGGAPLLEDQMKNAHQIAYVRVQKRMAKLSGKSMDILERLVLDIDESTDPANIGKANIVQVQNPNFDASKKPSKDNPMFLNEYVPAYNPTKYKENTQLTVVSKVLDNNNAFEKEQKALAEAERKLKLAQEKANSNLEEEEIDEEFAPYLDIQFDNDEPSSVN